MDAPILVIGATGNVGSEVVRQLSWKGVPVRAAVHSEVKREKMLGPGVETVVLDLHNGDSILRAMEGIEKIFLVLPLTGDMRAITRQVVINALKAGVRHIVKLSAMGTGPDAQITLGKLHFETEEIIKKSGIDYTFLRPNVFMQNFVNFFSRGIKSQGVFYFPAGDALVSFIDVRDIAAVAVKALLEKGHSGKAYTLTGPEAISHGRAAEILTDVLGDRITYVNVADEDAKKAMKDGGMSDWLIGVLGELNEVLRAGFMREVTPLVREITGNDARSFRQFAIDHAGAFRREKSAVAG